LLRLAPPLPEHDVDFESFVRSYESRLRRLVLRRIGDMCEAEEITQETLLRAYQHRASFSTEDELMAWSTVVAQRLVIDRVRVRGRSVAVAEVPESARLGRDTAEIVVARHEARAALESLEAIPTRQAAILWAREVEGLHYEEIAERFGITEPAVRSLLHRGRRALRAEFKNRTGSLPMNGLTPFAPWLLALKAAGKIRVAAKTVAKAPASAVAALSLTALVAVGITGIIHADTRPGDVRIDAAVDGANPATFSSEPVAAVARETAVRGTATSWVVRGSAGPQMDDLGPVDHLPSGCVKAKKVVCATPREGDHGAVLRIGPDLPDNPTDLRNVKVSQDYVGCRTLGIPVNPLVTCTQYASAQNGGSSAAIPDDPRNDSTEGALR
jgi:RNA polymerase sigma-70 factor (ECF subfamily)